jgi:polysaccharide export outer membrane protein
MSKRRNNRFLFGLIAIPLFLAGLAYGQNESLLIGPGDMLHVVVFETPELEQHARVTDAGDVSLLMGLKVHVANLSPAEAAKSIEDALSKGGFVNYPSVSVVVEEYATQQIYVLGEVKSPGAHGLRTPVSVIDALTMAGGLSELADRKILVERHGTKEQIPYFVSNQANVAFDSSIMVRPGDSVIVPRAGIAYALGDVKLPGGFTMTNNDGRLSVLELVARAGGTNHSAIPSHAKLIRKKDNGYVELALPLSDMQKGKVADIVLQPDDIVYVPFSYMRNFALNASSVVGAMGSAAVYRF